MSDAHLLMIINSAWLRCSLLMTRAWGPFFHEAAVAVLAKVKAHLAPKDLEQDFINYMDRFTVLD